jgi:hypothetical protein
MTKVTLKEAMNLSMVEQISFMQDTFMNAPLNRSMMTEDEYWAKLKTQAEVMLSEAQELYDGVIARDMNEVRDGTSDVLVTSLGFPHLVQFDVNEDMLEVFKSNISKVCPNIEDAHATQEKYKNIGVETYILDCPTIEGAYIIKVLHDVVGTDGKKYPANKFLKSVSNYFEPEFVK